METVYRLMFRLQYLKDLGLLEQWKMEHPDTLKKLKQLIYGTRND